jgi:hypothetical protein
VEAGKTDLSTDDRLKAGCRIGDGRGVRTFTAENMALRERAAATRERRERALPPRLGAAALDALRRADHERITLTARRFGEFSEVVLRRYQHPSESQRVSGCRRSAASTPSRASSTSPRDPRARSALADHADTARPSARPHARPCPPAPRARARSCRRRRQFGHRASVALRVPSIRARRADAPTPRAAGDSETRARCLRSPPSPSPSARP